MPQISWAEMRNLTGAALCETAVEFGPLTVMAHPGVGVTSCSTRIRQALHEQASIIHLLSLDRRGETAREAAQRFLHQFLLQTVAFRRRDDSILGWFPDICELEELAVPADGHWIDRLVEAWTRDCAANDDQTFLQTALSAPIRAAASGARVFVMIDDCHAAEHSGEAARVFNSIKNIYNRHPVAYGSRAAGVRIEKRTATHGAGTASFGALRSVEKTAARYNVRINDETRPDRESVQGNAAFIGSCSIQRREICTLDSFLKGQKVYSQEIFGGASVSNDDAVLRRIAPTDEIATGILSLLTFPSRSKNAAFGESWLKRLAIGEPIHSDAQPLKYRRAYRWTAVA